MRSFSRSRRRSSAPVRPFHHVLLIAMFAVMLAGTIGDQVVTARQADLAMAAEEATEEATEEPAATEEPEVTEEPDATEEAAATEEAMPTEEPMNELLGAIEIDYWECPAGYDIANPDLESLFQSCAGQNGVPFTVNASDGGTYQQQTGEYGDSHVSFTELPTGSTTVSRQDGGDLSMAWCNGIVQHGGPETGYQGYDVSAGSLGWDLQDDEIVFCSWLVAIPDEGNEQVGAIEIEYRECPDGYAFLDGANEDQLDQMLMECAPVDGVAFTIDQGGPDGPSLVTEDSHVSFVEAPAGMRTVTQAPAFASTYVTCEGIVSNGGPETGPMAVPVSNGAIQWNLLDDEVAYCHWFTMGETPVPGTPEVDAADEYLEGDIVVNFHECPATVDFATITDAGLASDCTIPVDGIVFQAISGAQYDRVAATGDAEYSVARFEYVTEGQVSVKQLTPPKQLAVLCQSPVADGPGGMPLQRMPITQATILLDLHDGETITCDWYAIPKDPGTGYVTVRTYGCPMGTDVKLLDVQAATLLCNENPPTLKVTVTNGLDGRESETGELDGVELRGIPSGQVLVSLDLPDTYEGVVVGCEVLNRLDRAEIVPFHRIPVSATFTISQPLGDDQILDCYWYLVPYEQTTGDNGRIVNRQYICQPAAVPENPTLDQLMTVCATDDREFEYEVEGPDDFGKRRVSVDGYTFFENIPPSEITLERDAYDPADEDLVEPVVYCDSLPRDQRAFMNIPMAMIPVENGQISYTIEPKAEVQCHWFSGVPAPGEYGHKVTVEITKWICPEGASHDEDDAWYKENCAKPHEGVWFYYGYDGGSGGGITGPDGKLALTDIPLGSFNIQEQIPTGYTDPVVTCHIEYLEVEETIATDPERVEIVSGYYRTGFEDLGTHYTLKCDWYNIPAGANSVTIYKYTCPAGYDPHAWEADPGQDCDEGPNGIAFSLGGPAAEFQSSTGDAIPYAVQFDSLSNGTYTITETVPEGIAAVFVWDCTGQRMGELRPAPLATGPTLQLTLDGSEDITCRWFNVPEYTDGTLTVIKYQCATPTYVSDLDCELYEGGQGFDLAWWDGSAWQIVASGATDGGGTLRFDGLETGAYWLDEQGGDWCQMTSDRLSADGNYLDIESGAETLVKVYNCGGTPGQPGKTPAKYPNTGVPPVGDARWQPRQAA